MLSVDPIRHVVNINEYLFVSDRRGSENRVANFFPAETWRYFPLEIIGREVFETVCCELILVDTGWVLDSRHPPRHRRLVGRRVAVQVLFHDILQTHNVSFHTGAYLDLDLQLMHDTFVSGTYS